MSFLWDSLFSGAMLNFGGGYLLAVFPGGCNVVSACLPCLPRTEGSGLKSSQMHIPPRNKKNTKKNPKLNMESENDGLFKRNLLFQGLIFRFHVELQGCTVNNKSIIIS